MTDVEKYNRLLQIAGDFIIEDSNIYRTPTVIGALMIARGKTLEKRHDEIGHLFYNAIGNMFLNDDPGKEEEDSAGTLLELGDNIPAIVDGMRRGLREHGGRAHMLSAHKHFMEAGFETELALDLARSEAGKMVSSSDIDEINRNVEGMVGALVDLVGRIFDVAEQVNNPEIVGSEFFRGGKIELATPSPFPILLAGDLIYRVLILINYYGMVLPDDLAKEFAELRDNGMKVATEEIHEAAEHTEEAEEDVEVPEDIAGFIRKMNRLFLSYGSEKDGKANTNGKDR